MTPRTASPALRAAADSVLAEATGDGATRQLTSSQGRRVRLVPFTAANGLAVLLASWKQPSAGKAAQEENALMEDAAHSLRLALDREEAGLAHQEAAALRRSGELQRDFLSRLSHELRTPLTAIRGYASSLMQPDVTWDRGSQDRFLDRIAAESARLGRLVDDLLDFSTIESGLMRLQPDWCDIPLVLQAAIACLPPAGTAAVSVQCDPGLPAVWADHDRLEQVFVNLINNAVGHNPAGTRVLVTADVETASEVTISVTDDGTGIPDDLALAPFEAGRKRRTRTGGAGLGLSIAHGIVQAHGGRIELQRLPRGSRFRVVLPVEAPDHLAETPTASIARATWRSWYPAAPPREETTVADPAANTRVLVVEDDPNIVDLIRSNLAVRGFDTVVSQDGMRVLKLLETEDPDIVLLDLMLPEADGFELCRQIRERSLVGIIVVSARGGERDKVTALNMGADDYLTKPFSIEELLARITATLRRTRPAVLPEPQTPVVVAGDITIDLARQQVTRLGQPVHLTPTEFALLRELATNRGKLLTHSHLLRRVWGHGYETETEYVRVYVRRLRAKLEVEGGEPLILTQPRAGYRFVPE